MEYALPIKCTESNHQEASVLYLSLEILTIFLGILRLLQTPIPLTSGDIFILGHSHVPLLEKDGKGIIHLNPGSPSRPRGPQGATVGIIAYEEVRIIRLKDGKVLANLGRMAKTSESEG